MVDFRHLRFLGLLPLLASYAGLVDGGPRQVSYAPDRLLAYLKFPQWATLLSALSCTAGSGGDPLGRVLVC